MLILTKSLSFLLRAYWDAEEHQVLTVCVRACVYVRPKRQFDKETYARPSVSDGRLHFVIYK